MQRTFALSGRSQRKQPAVAIEQPDPRRRGYIARQCGIRRQKVSPIDFLPV